jgi:hypothetical protein
MKIFILAVLFVVLFLICKSMVAPYFEGLNAINNLFSFTISLVLVGAGGGIADMLMADTKN